MAWVSVTVQAEQLRQLEGLAKGHFGNQDPESIGRVVELALKMRMYWAELVGECGEEVEEPVVEWDSSPEKTQGEDSAEVREWLFS